MLFFVDSIKQDFFIIMSSSRVMLSSVELTSARQILRPFRQTLSIGTGSYTALHQSVHIKFLDSKEGAVIVIKKCFANDHALCKTKCSDKCCHHAHVAC